MMQVLIRAKDFPVTEGLQSFTEQQAKKLTRYTKKIIRVETFVEKTRANTKATIKAIIPGQDVVVARQATDLYLAIQDAFDRAIRVMRKNTERKQARRKNGRG
mgnify:CR=1 FL=1